MIESLLNLIFDRAHPVGSYYWSSDSTNPTNLFGGIWEQVTDTFILAAGTTYPAGSSGGEATHKLSVNELPFHAHGFSSHQIPMVSGGGSISNVRVEDRTNSTYRVPGVPSRGANWNSNNGTDITGNNEPHNNMPPYVVAYCWRRTA